MARQAPGTRDGMTGRITIELTDRYDIGEIMNVTDRGDMNNEDNDSDATNMSTDVLSDPEDGTNDADNGDDERGGENGMEVNEQIRSPIIGERRIEDDRTHQRTERIVESQGVRRRLDIEVIEDSNEPEFESSVMSWRPQPSVLPEPEILEQLSDTEPTRILQLLHSSSAQQPLNLLATEVQPSSSAASAEAGQPLGPTTVLEPRSQAGPSCNTTPRKAIPAPTQGSPSPSSDDEGQICSICLEPWGNSGEHRLSSLKCGHLFGFACIEKWLKGQKGKCPQCNAKATKKDIRVLYAKSLKVLDTSERDRVFNELEKEREARRRLELEHAQTKLKYELKTQLVMKLQEELNCLRTATPTISGSQGINLSQSAGSSSQRKFKLIMHSGVDVIKDSGCRVMAYNEWLCMMVISMPSQVAMFPGYGVKKLNMLDLKFERYVPIHQKQIRDLCFNPAKNDLLLSVGMDKMVKLTNICSNSPVGSFTAEALLWSCCWNADEANQFFVGTASGSVIQYDTRKTTGPLRTIKGSGCGGPVVSMCYVPFHAQADFSNGGLIVARLKSCSFIEVNEDRVQEHPLPLEGPFTSVSFEKSTRHILVSCRPSQKHPHARHLVCELQKVNISSDSAALNNVITVNTIHTFRGGTTQKVLSRSCIFVNPFQEGNVLVCACDESTQSTCVWDLSTTSCVQQLKCSDTILDIFPVKSNQNDYLALLTDKTLKLYKWVDVL